MKDFLKNYWTWFVGIVVSALAIAFFCSFQTTAIEKAAFWSHLLLLLPILINGIMFPKIIFKGNGFKKYFLAFTVCWLAIAFILRYFMWANYIFAVAIFAVFALRYCEQISSAWFIIPFFGLLFIAQHYEKEAHDALPTQTDVVIGIYDRSKGYETVIIDLEKFGPYEIETAEANQLQTGDTVQIRIYNNKLEIVHN